MPGVQRQRISGHSPYEAVIGFSRAVVAGGRVLVAGTAPIPPGGGPPPDGAYPQARLCLDLIGEALAQCGRRPRARRQDPDLPDRRRPLE